MITAPVVQDEFNLKFKRLVNALDNVGKIDNNKYKISPEAEKQIRSIVFIDYTKKDGAHDIANILSLVAPPNIQNPEIIEWQNAYHDLYKFINDELRRLRKEVNQTKIESLNLLHFLERLSGIQRNLISYGDNILMECEAERISVENIDENFSHAFKKLAKFQITNVYIERLQAEEIPRIPAVIRKRLDAINTEDCFEIEIRLRIPDSDENNMLLAKALANFNANQCGCFVVKEDGEDKKINFYIKSTSKSSAKLEFTETAQETYHNLRQNIKIGTYGDKKIVLIEQIDFEMAPFADFTTGLIYFANDNSTIYIAQGKMEVHMRAATNIASYIKDNKEDAIELAKPIWKQSGIKFRKYGDKYVLMTMNKRHEVTNVLTALGIQKENITYDLA